jgi:hypothetical protein
MVFDLGEMVFWGSKMALGEKKSDIKRKKNHIEGQE